jgi:hypothetical protein
MPINAGRRVYKAFRALVRQKHLRTIGAGVQSDLCPERSLPGAAACLRTFLTRQTIIDLGRKLLLQPSQKGWAPG